MHVRFNSWYISLLSSAKQQHEMTKCLENVHEPRQISNFLSIYKSLKLKEAVCHFPQESVGKITAEITYGQNIIALKSHLDTICISKLYL